MSGDPRPVYERSAQLDGLIADLERSADPAVLMKTRRIVQVVLELHRDALARVVELCGQRQPALLDSFEGDELVASLLMLHDLHREQWQQRLDAALEGLHEKARRSGAELIVKASTGSRVLLLLRGASASASARLRESIEEDLLARVPDARIEIEVEADPPAGFVPVERLRGSASRSAR